MNKPTLSLLPALLIISCAFNAAASQVQYALPVDNINVSWLVGAGTPVSSNAIDRPSTMPTNHTYGWLHLGTNTDLYIDRNAPNQYWVSYELDGTSNEFHQYRFDDFSPIQTSTAQITGKLWLSFDMGAQSFNIYGDKLSNNDLSFNMQFYPNPYQTSVNSLVSGKVYSGSDYIPLPGTNASLNSLLACIECGEENRLNLSFLEFRWIGDRYDLFLSSQGFDQIFSHTDTFPPYDQINRYSLNIAPVPVPGTAWLMGSSLFFLITNARRNLNKIKLTKSLLQK